MKCCSFVIQAASESSLNLVKKSENVRSESPPQSGSGSNVAKQLLGRKESSTSRSVSPKVVLAESSTANATPAPQQVPRAKDMSDRSKKLIDDQQFVDKVSEFLSENPDFLVVGIVGPQSCGKSTIMNALAKDLIELKSSNDENNGGTSNGVEQNNSNFFRVQSFEKQMTGEHCTNGVYLWISPKHRIILIDSQPVNSPSFLDRTIQVSLGQASL